MGANMLIQFALTPFYLEYLGEQQFGVLMVLLNLINFASFGITWMSGGLVRVIGEYWSQGNREGFRMAFAVGKYAFTVYAISIVCLGIYIWWLLGGELEKGDAIKRYVFLAGLYLILTYEAAPERQAFVGTDRQATGNYIEVTRIFLFALIVYWLLPVMKDMSAVWIALMAGVLVQRVAMSLYWSKKVGSIGWKQYTSEMVPLLKRLAGRQGVGYVSYGVLLLILQADTVIVGFLGGAEMAGQFVLLWKIPEAISLLLWKVPSTIEPQVIHLDAKGDQAQIQTIFIQGRRWFFLLVATTSLFYVLFGQWLAQLWVGEHAPDQQWMYLAAGLALFFNTFSRWPVSFAYTLIKLRSLVRVAVIEVASKLILTIILFPYYGIASPIIATVITHIAYIAFAYQKIMRLGEQAA